MNKTTHSALDEVVAVVSGGKLRRWRKRPLGYPAALLHRMLIYKWRRVPVPVRCRTFFGAEMKISLPAGMDIYLTGGKTHESEIRLARYLIESVGNGGIVADVGAHYGYFTLLAAHLVGARGSVTAFEATPRSFDILAENTASWVQIEAIPGVVSDRDGRVSFYEFENLYSEYNSIDDAQYEGEDWYRKNPPTVHTLRSIALDDYFKNKTAPDLLKIDVEGAEFQVLAGAKELLDSQSPVVVMEYLCGSRGNRAHRAAEDLLRELSYRAYRIDENGQLRSLANAAAYLEDNALETDNIVFKKAQ